MKKALTRKQNEFCSHYVANGYNAYQAAISAGYSQSFAYSRAHKMVQSPAVKSHLSKAFNTAEARLEVGWEWKVKKLKHVIRKFIPDDEAAPIKVAEARVAIMALSELNQMSGDYAPSKKVSLTIDTTKKRLEEARRVYESTPRKYEEY